MPRKPPASAGVRRRAGSSTPRRARRGVVVAIDGPAGSGKSTVAREVARALRVRRLDTGAMYRALTWQALREKVDPSDGTALAALARRTTIEVRDGGIVVNGRPAGRDIRGRRVSRLVSQVSAHPPVRRELVRRQRQIIGDGGVVAEGRDIGTVVCPEADLKVFLTASTAERARRRHRELARAGVRVDYRTLQRELRRRDALDSTRPASPLVPARDAHVIDSTGRTAREVVAEIVRLARVAQRGRRLARPEH